MKGGVLKVWLATCDPVHQGWTRRGIANGLCMTGGAFFPRVMGGYNLYRKSGGIPDIDSELVGAASPNARSIATFAWAEHLPGGSYVYRLVPISGGGIENWTDATIAHASFDYGGDWVGGLPNAPSDLRLVPRSGGKFAVQWTYLPQGQEAEPQGFWLYTNLGTDEVDYGGIAGSMAYRPGKIHYEHITSSRPNGESVRWSVRAYSALFREEQNTNAVCGMARSEAPARNPVVTIEVV